MKYKKLRAALSKAAKNPREFAKAAAVMCRAHASATLAIKGKDGSALSAEERTALLAAAVAKEDVELEVDVLAYEQRPGQPNRNFVRFRDGAMQSLGRSGKGTPFLRNHDQYDVQSRAGTITSSSTEKILGSEGHAIRQTVKLTAPWAVEMALRGLLDTVSIGWNPTGEIQCSVCEASISECWHWPGDTVTEEITAKDIQAGKAAETKVVEFVFTEAELVETSVVNVPGVPTARIEEVRAALSAAFPSLRSDPDHEGSNNERQRIMDKELLALLGLAEDATEEQVKAAIQALKAKGAELEIINKVVERLNTLEADSKKREQDRFVKDALDTGRIAKGDEDQWRELHSFNPARAVELMAKKEPNSATLANAPRQSDQQPVITGGEPALVRRLGKEPLVGKSLARVLSALMSNPKALLFAEHAFGFDSALAKIAGSSWALGATAIANNADFDAARVGFHAAFLQSLEASVDPANLLFTTVPSNRSIEEWNFMGDLPQFEEWVGDRKLADLKGFKLRVENKKWSNGLRVKNDDFKDDALGLLPSQVGGLAKKAQRHRWDLMVKLLLNGFDGTAYPTVGDGLAYDGAFFFSDSHLGGNDNKMTVALDAAGLSAAELLFGSMKTLDGSDPLDITPTHLIVGPKLRTTAEKLMKQERLANGEDNINRGKYELIISPRIAGTYDDYWFLAALGESIKPMIFQVREEISTTETGPNGLPAFTADELWFGAQARYNVGYFEPRLIVGSAV